MQLALLVRVVVAALALFMVVGCARGIVEPLTETSDPSIATGVADASVVEAADEPAVVDAASPGDVDVGVDAAPDAPVGSCALAKDEDACFECCDAKFPTAIDKWFDAFDKCCPNDACSDPEYEKCELAADDACAKDVECSRGLVCEDACWQTFSSGP